VFADLGGTCLRPLRARSATRGSTASTTTTTTWPRPTNKPTASTWPSSY